MRAGAFFEDGTPAGQDVSHPSHGQEGLEATLEAVAHAVNEAAKTAKQKPEAVGLAIPGHVDNPAGMVRWAPNFGETVNGVFKHWDHVQIRKPLEAKTGLSVVMDNDANMAALGEYKFGCGKNDAKCLVLLTLGTGVGGGVVMAPDSVYGKAEGPLVLVGGNKGGAELGHTIVNYMGPDCNAGEYGSVESYAGRDAIVKRATLRINRGRRTLISDLVSGDPSKITPLTISQAAEKGDEVAIEIWEEVGTMIGVGVGNFINIFAPDVVALGGQIAKAGDFILKPCIKSARNVAIPSLFQDARIQVAEQIADGGMLGAAALAFESLKWSK